MIDGHRVLSLSRNVSFQQLGEGEGAVILSLDTGQLHSCNDTTAAFLAALDGKRTFDMAAAELQAQFDVAADELRADLAALATRLLAEGVIV